MEFNAPLLGVAFSGFVGVGGGGGFLPWVAIMWHTYYCSVIVYVVRLFIRCWKLVLIGPGGRSNRLNIFLMAITVVSGPWSMYCFDYMVVDWHYY